MGKKILQLFVAILMIVSCEYDLNRSLEFSDSNRNNFEVVLEHFENGPNPLKYEAAKFLI